MLSQALDYILNYLLFLEHFFEHHHIRKRNEKNINTDICMFSDYNCFEQLRKSVVESLYVSHKRAGDV